MIKILELDKRFGSSMWTTNHRFLDPATWALIGSGVASLGGSLVSSLSGSKMSKEQLQQQLELFYQNQAFQANFSREQFKRSADFEREMFDAENLYNSPIELMKRLEAAGINPQVALNGSLGSASSNAASAGNASTVTAGGGIPQLPREMSPFEGIGASLKNVGMDIATLAKVMSETKKNDTESERTRSLLSYEIDNLIADAEEKRSIVGLNQIKTNIEQNNYQLDLLWKEKQISQNYKKSLQEYENLVEEGNVLVLQGNVLKAEENLKKMEAALAQTKDTQLKETFAYVIATMKQNIATMKSQENLNYTNAARVRAETQTINALRDDLVSNMHWSAEKNRMETGISATEFKKMRATYDSEVQRLKNEGLITEEVLRDAQAKANMAEKENNIYYLKQGVDMVCDVANAAANVAKPWSSVSNNVRDNQTRSENNIRDNESRTKNYYDVDYDGKGNTKGARKRVFGNVR